MVRHALVLANPTASTIRDPAIRTQLMNAIRAALQSRGISEVDLHEPESAAATRTAALAGVAAGAEIIVAVGGDGTAREVAGAVANSRTALALIPGGTGNLFAAALGLPRSTAGATAALRTALARPVDLGVIAPDGISGTPGDLATLAAMPFLVACGTGLDARMILATNHEYKARFGVGAYILAGLALAGDLRTHPAAIEVDGVPYELNAQVIVVVNAGDLVPGVVRPRLPVVPDDGLLDVFALTAAGPVGAAAGALALLAGGSVGRSRVGLRLRGRQVRVAMSDPQAIQVDGDPFAPGGFIATTLPRALHVLLPPGWNR